MIDVSDEQLNDEPTEGDIVIQDGERGLSSIWQDGKEIAKGWSESENVLIRVHCEREKFWPDVWRVSDHGNTTLISREVYDDADADPGRIVYAHGYGWRDCDPLGSVIGFDSEAVDQMAEELIDEEYKRAEDNWIPVQCEECDVDACDCGDDCDCEDPRLDELLDFGTSTFTLAQIITDCLPYNSDGIDKLAELMRDGIAVI